MPTAEELIRFLNLQKHPKEGGYFRETYRATDRSTPVGYSGERSASTAIYYLLTADTFSALHRLATDEVFHLYLGGPVRMLQLFEGRGQEVLLGPDLLAGQALQVVVPRGVWQGSRLEPGVAFALLGCTVAPGFDYADYETGDRAALTAEYPVFAEQIRRLTM